MNESWGGDDSKSILISEEDAIVALCLHAILDLSPNPFREGCPVVDLRGCPIMAAPLASYNLHD